jgi:hypothetical protein
MYPGGRPRTTCEVQRGGRGERVAAAPLTEREDLDYLDDVRRWRFSELLRAGYDDVDAIELAYHTEIDLHWAADLVRKGCPSATAVRIAL